MFTAKIHFDGGADKETGLDEIINDTPDDVDVASQTSLPTIAVKQNSSSARRVIPQQTPKPSAEVIAEVFPSVPIKNYQQPPPHVVDKVFPQAVKTYILYGADLQFFL